MRPEFFKILYEKMRANPDIIALTGDLGFGGFDKIQQDLPKQFVNCGAAEQTMLDMACGLAVSGKIPICYSITTFLLYRGFETLRLYINHERIKVLLIGSGRDKDYHIDGFSHDSSDAKVILATLPNIKHYFPNDVEEMKKNFDSMLQADGPTFLSLRR